VKAFGEPRAVVDCEAPRRARELAEFAAREARRQGVRLEAGAAELLAERVGAELLVMRQEIAKLALLAADGGAVRRADVARSASALAEEPIWDLTDAIGEGRSADALALLRRMLAQGAPPPVLLAALASHVRKLLRVRHGGSVAGPPFVVRKLEEQARRARPARLLSGLAAVHEADERLKGRGVLPPELALERVVLALSS
jgi:DNA polymerase-3 subunit delta